MVEWWIYGGLMAAGLVFAAIEWRIMRKPGAQRSAGEQRYLTGSRKVAKGFNQGAMKVLPWILVANGVLLLLLTIPFWMGGDAGLASLLTAFGLAAIIGGIVARWFYRRRRGPDWWAKQEQANAAADEKGYPRIVGSTRGGIVFGAFLAVMGVALLAINVANDSDDLFSGRVLPIVVILGGVFFLVGSMAQRRNEQER